MNHLHPLPPSATSAARSLPLAPLALFAGVLLGFVLLAATGRAQVLVSDYNLARVLRYEADGSSPAVLVAPADGGLDQPHRARLGPDGNLYVASAGTDQILRYDAATGAFIDVFIGGDPDLDYPVDFTFRPDGRIYVTSQLTSSVLRYDSATGARDASWIATTPGLAAPSGLAFDDAGKLYVSGRFSSNLARFDLATGAHELTFGDVPFALGVTLLPDGRLLVASGDGDRVDAFAGIDTATPAQSTFAGGLAFPVGIEFDLFTGTVLVANYAAGSISRHALADGAALAPFASGDPLSGPNYFTVLTPVPEPAACASLAGLSILVVALLRRRGRPNGQRASCWPNPRGEG